MRSTTKATVAKARRLRAEPSLPEALLWRHLREGPVKFRRQHPIGPYVADFYCPRAKLVVEVDGAAHEWRVEYDAERDAFIASRDLNVIRIAARDVLRDPEFVADAIVRRCIMPLRQR